MKLRIVNDMFKKLSAYFLLVILAFFARTVHASEMIIYPSGDGYVNQADENALNGSKTSLVSSYEGQGKAQLSYVKFSLASIPQGSLISSATFQTTAYSCSGADQTPELTLSTVIDEWSEQTMRWMTRPRTGLYIGVVKPSAKTLSWNATSRVQNWFQNPAGNYGFELAIQGGPFTCKFYSREYSTASVRPMLIVKYTAPTPTPTKAIIFNPIIGKIGIKITPIITGAAQTTVTPTEATITPTTDGSQQSVSPTVTTGVTESGEKAATEEATAAAQQPSSSASAEHAKTTPVDNRFYYLGAAALVLLGVIAIATLISARRTKAAPHAEEKTAEVEPEPAPKKGKKSPKKIADQPTEDSTDQ